MRPLFLKTSRRGGEEGWWEGEGKRSPGSPLKGFPNEHPDAIRGAFCPRVRITLHFSQMNLKYNYENYLACMNKAKLLLRNSHE